MAKLSSDGDGEEVCFDVRWTNACARERREWFHSHLLPTLNQPNLAVWFQPNTGGDDSKTFLVDVAPHITRVNFCSRENVEWMIDFLTQRQQGVFKFQS